MEDWNVVLNIGMSTNVLKPIHNSRVHTYRQFLLSFVQCVSDFCDTKILILDRIVFAYENLFILSVYSFELFFKKKYLLVSWSSTYMLQDKY